MVGEKIFLRKRVGLAVLTVLMLLSAVFGAILLRSFFGDTAKTANAEGVTIGSADNSQSWINSQNIRLRDGDSVTFEFDNYSNGTDVWFNWLAVVRVNDANNITLRADNYLIINDVDENGNIVNFESDSDVRHWNGIGITFSEGKSWDTFASDLNGAHVVMTFSRTGNTISMTAVDSKNSNIIATHTLNRSFNSNVTTDVFVTIDKAHLENFVIKGVNVVGATDFTTPYLGAYSNKVIFEEGQRVGFTFTNYSDKLENYHNWIACLDSVTDARIVMLRADNWENIQDANTGINSNYNWDTFKDEMNASYVTISFTHLGSSVKIRADIVGSSGTEFFEEYTKTEIEGSVKASLTVENSFLMNMAYTVYSTVTYNTNGGLDVAAEQYVTALSNPLPTPTREGYTFAGWFTNEGLTETATAGATITENTTLYAKWTINTNTVTFVTAHGNAPEAQNVEYNATATKPADPTANGYTFNGWYLNDSEYDFATPVTSEISLTANWTATEYSISYTLNGGEATNPTSYTVATETFTLTNPTKVGYTFAGWTGTDLDAATETVTIEVGSTGAREYTATWNVVEYKITYDLDLGEWEEVGATTYTVATETFSIPTPVRPGYTFVKWTNAADETVTEIVQGSTSNVTLTANWSEDDTSIFIATWNLVLNDRIGIRYQMEGVATSGYSVKFSINGRKDVSASVSLENEEYWYTLYINALEMGDEVTVSVYSGDTEVKRLSGSTAVAYCKMVEGYSAEQRATYNITDEARALVESLHDYGYYMGQTGWSDGCEHTQVADSKNVFTSESITAVVEAGDVFNTTFDKTLDESSVSKATMSMTFSDQSTINFFVYLNDGYSVESATINGVATTPTLVDNNSNKYQVTTARLKPTELAGYKTVIITAVNGDNTEHVTVLTASALTYVKLVLNNESFTDTVKYAITSYYNYYVAATAYASSVISD